MNNITLNEDQLWQLRNFIIKRGIKEADVVNEILDHFACKVEEILSTEKNMPFDRAMQLAHQSFGKSGFRPLVAEYEKQVEKVMWSVFKQEIKNVLLSPIILILASIGIIAVPTLNLFASKINNHWLFDLELMGILLIVTVSGFYYALIFRKLKWKIKAKNDTTKTPYYWQKLTLSIPKLPFIAVLIGILFGKGLLQVKIYTIVLAFYLVISLVRVLAQYQTFLAMEKRFGIGARI